MAIQITNNTFTLDLFYDGNNDRASISKENIRLEKSGDTVIIVDSGSVPAKEYKILYSDVTPSVVSSEVLYTTLNGYVNTSSLSEIEVDISYIEAKVSTEAFLADVSGGGTEKSYLPAIDFKEIYGLPWGLRLRKGTKDRLIFRIQDNLSTISTFNAIATGTRV